MDHPTPFHREEDANSRLAQYMWHNFHTKVELQEWWRKNTDCSSKHLSATLLALRNKGLLEYDADRMRARW
jgi:hypothetical protein